MPRSPRATPRLLCSLSASAILLVCGCAAATQEAPAAMLVADAPAPGAIAPGADASTAVGFPEYPSLSPDGKTVVFAWAGDLWAVPTAGGPCARLTVHPADERRSAFSPDGKWLAFESTRDGARNLYVMPITRTEAGIVGGTPRRVTASDRPQNLGGFSADGKSLLFSASIDPTIYRTPRMYRVPMNLGSDSASFGGVIGGPVTKVSDAHGTMPRATADGSGILFYRGYCPPDRPKYRGSGACDVWRASTADGSFTQLTTDGANDFDAWPLPDGSAVFISARDGQNNLWRVGKEGEGAGKAQQLTSFKPSKDQLTIGAGVRDLAVSADGKTAVFCVWDRMYRLDLTDPKAAPAPVDLLAAGDAATLDVQRISVDKEASEAVLSPDGKTIAVVARGEVFVRSTQEGYPTRRVTSTAGRERDLAWSPDGRTLYFASDDPALAAQAGGAAPQGEDNLGKYSVYGATVALCRDDITAEKKPGKSDDAKKDDAPKDEPKADAKPEAKGDEAKKDDAAKPDAPKADAPKAKKPKQPDWGKRWSEALTFKIEPVVVDTDDTRHPVPSPDGRLLVVTHGLGDVVLVDLESGKRRTLLRSWDDAEAVWAPDSRHLVYAVSDLDFNSDIWLMDTGGPEAMEAKEAPKAVNLTQHPDNDTSPRLSADGKVLTFLSQRGEQDDRDEVFQIYLDRALEGLTAYERDEYFKKAGEAAGKRKPAETPAFVLKNDPVAKAEEAKAAKTDEAKKDEPKKDEPAKDGEKKDGDKKDEAKADAAKPGAKPAAKKKPEPMKFDSDDAYLRVRRITNSAGGKGGLAVTPGADRIMFTTTVDGESSLVSVDHKGQDRKALSTGAASGVGVSLTGDKVTFVKAGVANSTTPKGGGKVDALPIDAPIMVDVAAQQRQKFFEAARTFGDRFYHPTMKGLDWPGLTKRYVELAARTRTSESFNRVAFALMNEVEGSHIGVTGGPAFSAPSPATGYLGVRVRPVPGGFEVVRVAPGSPADQRGSRLNVGDVIVGVDGKRLAADDTSLPAVDLDAALMGRAGRETLVEVRRTPASAAKAQAEEKAAAATAAADKGEAHADAKTEAKAEADKPVPPYVLITPCTSAAWTTLAYNEEVLSRRARVEKLSGGRVGYLHIRGMGAEEVRDYERDLYAAAHGREALVVDVRDNGGGWTADILLSSLTAPAHAYTAPRGADLATVPHDAYPRDRRLIYAWTRPIDVLINEHSFSNAEIFAHAIKTTGRGRLVGTPTFGGVISTGAFTLIDGTNVRMPFRGWYLPDGTDMENNGAQPDVPMAQNPADEAAGRDPQLEAAVIDLLKRLDEKKGQRAAGRAAE